MPGIQDASSTAIPINLTHAEQARFLELGKKTAHLAHQIRTPLSAAVLYTEHLAEYLILDACAKKWITALQTCHTSIEKQIHDLLLFARGNAIVPTLTSMRDWCTHLEESVRPFIQKYSAKLVIYNELEEKEVLLHTESLTGAVHNLILNALQAQAKQVWITIQQMQSNWFQLVIQDDGVGMSEDVTEQAMTPFFTTRNEGTGLGLAVVNSVVHAHRGEMKLDSSLGKGCSITINLPG